jgi:hypothetical protein
MKSSVLTIGAVGMVALALASPIQTRDHIASNDGAFRIEFAARGRKFQQLPDRQTRVSVSDLTGVSRTQGVEFSGDRATVVTRPVDTGDGKGTQIVDSADLSGNAKVTSTSPGNRTTLESASVHLQETTDELTVTTPGSASVVHSGSDGQTKSRSVIARGDKLAAKLEPFASKAKQRLRTVDLVGKVKIDLDTVQVSDKKDETIYKATVTGSRALMTASVQDGKTQWTIRLTGSVHLVGDQTVGGVTTNADVSLGAVTIVLNDKMELVSFEGGDE